MQIALFLLLAMVIGIFIGWRFIGSKPEEAEVDQSEELIASKRRLDQCHRENAKLRRASKQHKDELEKINKQMAMEGDADIAAQLEAANAQIQALMDDVQMRDDMITALEKQK